MGVHGASRAVVAWDLADDGLWPSGVVAVSQAGVPAVVLGTRLGGGEVARPSAVVWRMASPWRSRMLASQGWCRRRQCIAGRIVEGGVIVLARMCFLTGRVVSLAFGSG